MASRAPAPAPPLRRRERQWAGRAADGVGGEAGWGGMRCYGLTADGRRNRPTSSRRKEEPSVASPCRIRGEKERRFPNPDVSHPPLHEPTHTYGLPLHELTSTSTFALLRAIFAPVAGGFAHPFVFFAPSLAARSTRTVLPDAIPGLSSSSLLLVLSSGVVAFPAPCPCTPFALVVLTHGAADVPALRAENGERRTRVVWRPWSWSWSSSIHDVTGTENPSLLATATRRDTRGLYAAVYVTANDYYVGFSR